MCCGHVPAAQIGFGGSADPAGSNPENLIAAWTSERSVPEAAEAIGFGIARTPVLAFSQKLWHRRLVANGRQFWWRDFPRCLSVVCSLQ
jgi:hypothetical protein